MNDLMLTTLVRERLNELRHEARSRMAVRQALIPRSPDPAPAPTPSRRPDPARRTPAPVCASATACACSA